MRKQEKGSPTYKGYVGHPIAAREVVAWEPISTPENQNIFKKYPLPNGDILELTREEFENVVELFRLLLKAKTTTSPHKEKG